LHPNGSTYSIDQLFDLWKPTQFSSETIEAHRAQSEYTQLYSCPNCGLEIFLPQIIGTPSFYTELQANERQGYYEEDKWEFSESLQEIHNSLSIIEIGCGTGNFLAEVKDSVRDAWGIEYNLDAIQCARKNGLNVVHIGEENLLKKASFDLALSFHVLEHIENPMDFVIRMKSWVKKGGKICISVPNQDGPLKYIDPCIMNMPPHHATRWHKKTFEVLAEKSDLQIERIAFEPLSITDHYYYSHYGVNSIIPGETPINRFARFILSNLSSSFFEFLKIIQIKRLKFLKGQSIYVVMSKR
jgi:SAM-dependent methyltransferase